jgi:hypothetical protein
MRYITVLFNLLAQSEYAAKQLTQQAAEQNENTKHTPDVRTKVSRFLIPSKLKR